MGGRGIEAGIKSTQFRFLLNNAMYRPHTTNPPMTSATPPQSGPLHIPRICLGTMTFGQQNTEAEAHAQLSFALEQGVDFFDTAEMYPVPTRAETTGRTELYVGSWLKTQQRDKIFLATKAAGPGRGLNWIRDGHLSFTRDNLHRALDGSLKRLQTDYVDLYQLHWPDRNVPLFGQYHFDPQSERDTVPLEVTLAALGESLRAGKIRHWGLSNETPWGVMTALRLADAMDLPRPVSVQNAYSLLNRTWENGLAEVAYRERIALLAYSPLGFGLLTAKYRNDPHSAGRMQLFKGFGARYAKPQVDKAVAAYADLAAAEGLTPTQLALGFASGRWCVGSVILGATSVQQLGEDLRACRTVLSPRVLAAIEDIHLAYPNPAP